MKESSYVWLTAFFSVSQNGYCKTLSRWLHSQLCWDLSGPLCMVSSNSNNHHSGDNWKEQRNKSVQVLDAEPPWPKPLWVIQRLKTVSHAMLLSLPITAKYFRRHAITFGYAAERWFRQELVGTDIPCWPNYYSLLCCHIRSSSKTTGLSVPASSGDGDEHRLALWSRLSRNVSWTGWSAPEPLPNVCITLCGEGFLPVYSTLNFSWWEVDYFWQALAKLNDLALL